MMFPKTTDVPWRCFHCDEVFTDQTEARDHFGCSVYDTPACQLTKDEKGVVGLLRQALAELARYHEEDTDMIRETYKLGSKHETEKRQRGEDGYARGLRDARHPFKLLSAARKAIEILSRDSAAYTKERQINSTTFVGKSILLLHDAIKEVESVP